MAEIIFKVFKRGVRTKRKNKCIEVQLFNDIDHLQPVMDIQHCVGGDNDA